MGRLDIERQKELEPKRIAGTKKEIEALGFEIIFECDTRIEFLFKGEVVRFWPYSGWHSGKSIKDGRGFENLIKQLKH